MHEPCRALALAFSSSHTPQWDGEGQAILPSPASTDITRVTLLEEHLQAMTKEKDRREGTELHPARGCSISPTGP